jgi:hypothetical protein
MELKHRWSVSHNFLTGLTADGWWKLLRDNGFNVDAPYWHRAALITLTSLLNSHYRRREENQFAREIDATEVGEAPLFIIGHWRSGTTHLHNLLAQDADRFAFPNTYQVVNPHTFLITEKVNTRRFAKLLPDKRPMDNMALSFEAPQEDEFAPCLMTGYSPYLGVSFPRRESEYERYLTFEGVPEEEVEAWKRAMLRFVKKLTLKYRRPVLLKSPTHTARIGRLLEIFPGARFLHIHRNPYEVYQSFLHYYDTAAWFNYLQRPDRSTIKRTILERYVRMFDAFFAQRDCIPEGNFHEVRFEDLERDPAGVLAQAYGALSLGDFESARPGLERYVASLNGYRKNAFPELTVDDRHEVAEAWRRNFEAWRYPE